MTYRPGRSVDQSSGTIGRGAGRFDTQADSFVNPGDIITIDERLF
jgi:hypothetical protein